MQGTFESLRNHIGMFEEANAGGERIHVIVSSTGNRDEYNEKNSDVPPRSRISLRDARVHERKVNAYW